jgi:hypothetical protein
VGGKRFCSVVVLVGAVCCACTATPGPVAPPTFPAPAPSTSPSPAAPAGDLDCASLLPQAEVVAVLGLPLDGIVANEVRDVAAPQVRRLGRLRCSYSSVNPRGPVTGLVLVATVGTFADPGAAHAQYERNLADVAGAVTPLPARLGEATAAIVPLAGRSELLAVYRDHTIEIAASDRVGGMSGARAAIVNIARRVMARLPGSARTP